ncbi:MAG: signal peptide peptidase SppA [Bacillota bacterium]|nr:signal peptide peptidase SppA [Bacillota bacterium]
MGEFQVYERNLGEEPKRGKSRKGLIVLVIVLAVIIVLGASVNSCVQRFTFESGELTTEYPAEDYIAILYVDGEIGPSSTDVFGNAVGYQHSWTMTTIDDLMEDYYNAGIFLFVDSPGGTIYESDELYLKLEEYQEQTERPVYVYMGSMAASGGYYVSAGADKILANRNCWTGSIGVTVGSFFDLSGLLERYGVDTVTINSGEHKAMGSYLEPMSDEERAIWQALIDEAYDQFVGVVADGRGMAEADVRTLADGRVYSAWQALELGLIDGVCTLEEAQADMQTSCGLEWCEFYELYYQDTSFLSSLTGLAGTLAESRESGDVSALLSIIEESNRHPISYLCEVGQ